MDRFLKQHSAMIDSAQKILAAANDQTADASERLAQQRLSLAKEISSHVTEELQFIRSSAWKAGAADQRMMTRYHDELLNWRQALMTVNFEWPLKKIMADPAGFRRAFGPIVVALRARVRWEEQDLYPALAADSSRNANARAAA